MTWVILISMIMLFLFTIILSRPLRIVLEMNIFQDEQLMSITITLCKVNIYQKEWSIKNKQLNGNSTDTITIINSFIKSFRASTSHLQKIHNKGNKIKQISHLIFKNSILHNFTWITTIGTGSASTTGIVAGGLWTTKQTVHMILFKIKRIECRPKLKVIPNFQFKEFSTELVCIISIRLVKAIFISLMFSRKIQVKFKNN